MSIILQDKFFGCISVSYTHLYADDIVLLAKSKRASERLLESSTKYLEERLKLTVNREKSRTVSVFAIRNFKFLGFALGRNGKGIYVRVHPKSWKKFKSRLKELSSRKRCQSIKPSLEKIKVYARGWLNYYGIASMKNNIDDVNGWLYHRIRMCIWKQWKLPRTKKRNLIKMGIHEYYANMAANCRRGHWYCANLTTVKKAMTKERLINSGFYDLATAYQSCLLYTSAKIVDYKSSFTSRHSIGVAEKASMLAQYMGYDSITVQKMYLAGALHDIGKMAVGNEILEKPDKLTDDEFSKMKNHAGYTYLILSEVNDFEEIRDWAAFHHEKLNGKGYPFGKTAAELNEPERMMACVDIYQALTEDRPYKKGLSHEKTCDILDDMAQKDFIDSDISKIIRECFGRNR